MESRYHAPAHVNASRPSLGFPLGTALLLIIIFSLSGVFSCCYHWDKLRSLRRSVSSDTDPEADNNWPISKPKHTRIVVDLLILFFSFFFYFAIFGNLHFAMWAHLSFNLNI